MELEKRKSLPKYLPPICQFLAAIGADFQYCASIIEVTASKKDTGKALAAVVQEEDGSTYGYRPSGKKVETLFKCWNVTNVSQMFAASLFLGEKKQPAVLKVSLEKKQQLPSDLWPLLQTVAQEFEGELKLTLNYSFDDYEPVDSLIVILEGAR